MAEADKQAPLPKLNKGVFLLLLAGLQSSSEGEKKRPSHPKPKEIYEEYDGTQRRVNEEGRRRRNFIYHEFPRELYRVRKRKEEKTAGGAASNTGPGNLGKQTLEEDESLGKTRQSLVR